MVDLEHIGRRRQDTYPGVPEERLGNMPFDCHTGERIGRPDSKEDESLSILREEIDLEFDEEAYERPPRHEAPRHLPPDEGEV